MKPSTMKSDWVKLTPEQIGKLVVEMNKEGLNASQIGIKLRDEHAISSIKSVTGKNMKQFIQNHLKSNKGDRKNVRSLELLEAKVHRLSKYYKKKNVIPKNWKYKAVIAQLS